MSLSPHELVKIRRQHIFVYPFHSLELPLDPVPVGLHVLGVDTSRRDPRSGESGSQCCVWRLMAAAAPGCRQPTGHCGLSSQICRMGRSVAAVRFGTISMTPSAGV